MITMQTPTTDDTHTKNTKLWNVSLFADDTTIIIKMDAKKKLI